MKFILLLFLLSACATTKEVVQIKKPTVPKTKYKVGDCAVVFDPETGNYKKDHIVKIERIEMDKYVYRWWLPQKEWALDTNEGIGKFKVFEKMTRRVKCPSQLK